MLRDLGSIDITKRSASFPPAIPHHSRKRCGEQRRRVSLGGAKVNQFNRVPLRTFALVPFASLLLSFAASAEEVRQVYHIAPGPLDEVLLNISRQSGQVISFTPQLGNYSSASVDGSLSAQQAVDAALKGTGLQVQVSPDGAFIITEGASKNATRNVNAQTRAAQAPNLDRVVAIGTRRSGNRRPAGRAPATRRRP